MLPAAQNPLTWKLFEEAEMVVVATVASNR